MSAGSAAAVRVAKSVWCCCCKSGLWCCCCKSGLNTSYILHGKRDTLTASLWKNGYSYSIPLENGYLCQITVDVSLDVSVDVRLGFHCAAFSALIRFCSFCFPSRKTFYQFVVMDQTFSQCETFIKLYLDLKRESGYLNSLFGRYKTQHMQAASPKNFAKMWHDRWHELEQLLDSKFEGDSNFMCMIDNDFDVCPGMSISGGWFSWAWSQTSETQTNQGRPKKFDKLAPIRQGSRASAPS